MKSRGKIPALRRGNGLKVPPLVKKLFTSGTCWKRKISFPHYSDTLQDSLMLGRIWPIKSQLFCVAFQNLFYFFICPFRQKDPEFEWVQGEGGDGWGKGIGNNDMKNTSWHSSINKKKEAIGKCRVLISPIFMKTYLSENFTNISLLYLGIPMLYYIIILS